MTVEDKAKRIIEDIKYQTGVNPVRMFRTMADKDYINIHGPEHHILDGACLLVCYKNAGGDIDLDVSLEKLMYEGLRMPGAMCGYWGVCGAITSMGAALALIDGTGPLTNDGSWGKHMEFTSSALASLGHVNGPRCCKRDAMLAFEKAIEYVNSHYDVHLEYEKMSCSYSDLNKQCIKERCPFYKGK